MEFREQLMELRKQRGWSLEQLGAKIGVTRQTVSKWETGDTTPELAKLIELSSLFEISVDQLIGIEERKDTAPVYIHETGWNYEYKSKTTFWGLPLVHINVGRGLRRAKGVIAVGNCSVGIISTGGLSAGIISIGGLSGGIVSIGGLSIALLLSVGGVSIGTIALGGLAVGYFAAGGLALGVYSLGGCAAASRVAAGGAARGVIAIGDQVRGTVAFPLKNGVSSVEIRQAILDKFPGTWKWLVRLYGTLGR